VRESKTVAKDRYDIFLSYFRDDSGGWTALLHHSLSERVAPARRAFKDDVETDYGVQWAPRLSRLVRTCEFFLVIITPDWAQERIQSRLRDPGNWVRNEILAALDSGKTIIPVLMNGATLPPGLPEELTPAISALQCFSFSKGSEKWESEVTRLARRLIDTAAAAHHRFNPTRRFAQLDRVLESSCVRAVAQRGDRVIAVCANDADSPLVFAQRCGMDVTEDKAASDGFIEPNAIDWMSFVENISPEQRRQDLLGVVAKRCGVTAPGDRLDRELVRYFAKNRQTMVFHTTIPSRSRAIPERMDEWLTIWRGLLRDCRARNVLVILFFPRSILFARRPTLAQGSADREKRLLAHGLRKVERDHLTAFIKALANEGCLDGEREQQMQEATARLFRFRMGIGHGLYFALTSNGRFGLNLRMGVGQPFKKVVETLKPILQS
jgi:hypothetical protein